MSEPLHEEQLELFDAEAQPPAASPARDRAAFEFFLGTHHPAWLALTDVPLFVSRRRIAGRATLPRARGPWALDSGGFTELSLHGRWTITPREYAALVARLSRDVGQLRFAAAMDWMCEAEILKRTGLDVAEHQRRTITSYLDLKSIAPELPWMPVLQGWTRGDYLDHLDDYARAGVDLTRVSVVGVGTMCRRQHTLRAALLLAELKELGLNLHAFGFKAHGLRAANDALASSDSLAWSLHARKSPPLLTCTHRRCLNCLAFALEWRERLIESLAGEGT